MARMRQILSPSQGVDLINSLIEGTQVQKDLVAWKEKNSFGSESAVKIGVGYCIGFKKRNEHLIVSKKGGKYKLDRDR